MMNYDDMIAACMLKDPGGDSTRVHHVMYKVTYMCRGDVTGCMVATAGQL